MRELEFHDPIVIANFNNEDQKEKTIEWDRDTCTCDDGPTDAYGN